MRNRSGFPDRIMLRGGEVVDADPLLPTAAHFLDKRLADASTDSTLLADGLQISRDRAEAILDQLEALGHVHDAPDHGERAVFDPDGLTDPTPLDRPE